MRVVARAGSQPLSLLPTGTFRLTAGLHVVELRSANARWATEVVIL